MAELLTLAAMARWLLYAGALVAVGRGTVAFLDPEWKAGARSVHDTVGPRMVARLAAVALLAAVSLLLWGQLTALEMTRADIPVLLGQTSWGLGWSQLAGASALAAVALLLPMGRTTSLLLLMAALGVAVAMGGLGHAAADEQWPIGARLLDAMHVAAMGAWLGGLLCTVLIVRVPAFPLRHAAWRTFSRTATVMAPVTLASGVGSAARVLLGTAPNAILASDYGRLLVLKTALAAAILFIGAGERRRIANGKTPESRRVGVELGIAGAVLLVTALLTGTEPPGE